MRAAARALCGAVAVLAAVGTGGPVRAQTPVPGGLILEGGVEAGLRAFIDEPSPSDRGKLEEYRDFNNGLFLEDLRLRLYTTDNKYLFDLAGRQWGLQDQEYYLGAERLGLFRFDFGWNQIPHVLSTTGRLLASKPDQDVFLLPTPRPALDLYNSGRQLDEIGFRTDIANMLFKLTPTPDLDLIGEYTRTWKHGDRPFGVALGSPGNNFYEVLEPINSYTHDVRLRATWAKEIYQLQFDYGFSLYQNSFSAIQVDNPCFANTAPCSSGDAGGPATGQSSLPPDNYANTFSLSGGVNLPWWHTRLTGNFTYGFWRQNESFLPMTINPALASNPAVRLPQSSLNGNVQNFLVNLGVVTRPLRPLTVTGKYRYYSYNDWSDAPVFETLVQDDRSLLEGRRATRLDYDRHDASLDGRWRFNRMVALTAGAGWEHWDRSSGREVPKSNEYFGKVALDVTPYDWLVGRLLYKPSFRRIDEYNTGARESTVVLEDEPATTSQSPLLRKYDEADRDMHRINLTVTATPFGRFSPLLDTLTLAPTFSWKWADYINSPLGLQKSDGWAAGIDASWKPTERFSAYFGYMHERNTQDQRGQNRPVEDGVTLDFPDFVWDSRMLENVDTVYAGLQIGLIPGVLEWATHFSFSNAVSTNDSSNPITPVSGSSSQQAAATAESFPAFTNQLIQVTTRLRFNFWKNWSASVFYTFEQFRQKNWQTDDLNPFMPGVSSIWLGNTSENYAAHLFGATLGYRF